jgi:hypothetical protein
VSLSHYEILGVKETDSKEVIYDAFNKIANIFVDPSMCKEWATAEEVVQCDIIFDRMFKALRVLRDPVARAQYDAELREARKIPETLEEQEANKAFIETIQRLIEKYRIAVLYGYCTPIPAQKLHSGTYVTSSLFKPLELGTAEQIAVKIVFGKDRNVSGTNDISWKAQLPKNQQEANAIALAVLKIQRYLNLKYRKDVKDLGLDKFIAFVENDTDKASLSGPYRGIHLIGKAILNGQNPLISFSVHNDLYNQSIVPHIGKTLAVGESLTDFLDTLFVIAQQPKDKVICFLPGQCS